MLLVETSIKPSSIHGVGLFAEQDIFKGDVIWRFSLHTCRVFSFQEFLSLCEELPLIGMLNFIHYSYIKNNQIIYLTDNCKFINHGKNPNIGFINDQTEVALRDIKKGEEFIEDYSLSYDPHDFFLHSEIFEKPTRKKILSYLGGLNANGKHLLGQI